MELAIIWQRCHLALLRTKEGEILEAYMKTDKGPTQDLLEFNTANVLLIFGVAASAH